jgi:hypothetical protein
MKAKNISVGLICIVIAICSLYQTLTYVSRTPAGMVYPLTHNYEQDYFWYLSLMRQGWDGSLLLTSRFTPEKFAPQLVNTFFPLAGTVARIFGINLPFMYTLLRVFFGGGLLFAGHVLLKELKLPKLLKISGMLFIIFGAPFWFIDHGALRQMGEFWTGFDPIFRITWLPHHLAANICLIISIIIFSKSLRSFKLLMIAGISAGLCGWFNPGSLIILLMAVGIGGTVYIWQIGLIRQIWRTVFFGVVACLPMIWLIHIQNTVFPWTAFRDWERFVQYPIDFWGLFGVMGIVGILGMLGIPLAIAKKEILWNLLVGWFMAPIIGLVIITRFMPISNSRFLQGAFYIPGAILATLTLGKLGILGRLGMLGKLGRYMIVGLILLFQIPAFVASVSRQNMYIDRNLGNPLVMISGNDWKALSWLAKNGRKDALILISEPTATLIPAFTSLRVFFGHPTFSLSADIKREEVNRFYQNPAGELAILKRYEVNYIWLPNWINPESLNSWEYQIGYRNPAVTIFVKKL